MDILTLFLLFVAATAVGGLAYIIVWIVQAVRRVGIHSFSSAIREFMRAVFRAIFRNKKHVKSGSVDDHFLMADGIRIAQESQKLSEEGSRFDSEAHF